MPKKSFYITLVVVLLLACSEEPRPPYQIPKDAKTLLAGSESKSWKLARRFNNKTRMNMGDCFLSHRDTYSSDMTMHNNSGENVDCGETLNAQWKFVKDKNDNYYIRLRSDQLPAMMNIEEDFKLFKVLYLSEEEMVLQFQHRQFSNKTSTITDIYVPEGVSVEGREFHW